MSGAKLHHLRLRDDTVTSDPMKRRLLVAEKGDANSQFNLGVLHDNRLDDNNHCPYRKLRPTVLVVQATEDGYWNDPAEPVDRSMDWASLFGDR